MERPFPLRFGLPSPAKCLRVERVEDKNDVVWLRDDSNVLTGGYKCTESRKGEPHWRLWLMANGDFTLGTFIQLLDNGKINRVTWHEDGTESVLEVKDE